MSSYKFSSAERYAIFLMHGMKCYLCQAPLDLSSMVVDHVLPESLESNPTQLGTAKSALGLAALFDLNSFENWLPACVSCNGKKSALRFEPSLLIQVQLQKLSGRADNARRLRDVIVRTNQVARALNTLERAQEGGQTFDLSTQARLVLLGFAIQRGYLLKGEPLRLTQSSRLVPTAVEDAMRWGVTHWSMPPREPGQPALVVLFQVEEGECIECGVTQRVFQPINQEGGGDPICEVCLSNLDWLPPVALGDLPTHASQE